MIGRLHLRLRGRLRTVLLLGGVLLIMGGAALLVNPSGTNRTKAQDPASTHSTSSLSATRRAPSPSHSSTATQNPAPSPSPSHTRTPPPASGYFGLKPVGSWSSL